MQFEAFRDGAFAEGNFAVAGKRKISDVPADLRRSRERVAAAVGNDQHARGFADGVERSRPRGGNARAAAVPGVADADGRHGARDRAVADQHQRSLADDGQALQIAALERSFEFAPAVRVGIDAHRQVVGENFERSLAGERGEFRDVFAERQRRSRVRDFDDPGERFRVEAVERQRRGVFKIEGERSLAGKRQVVERPAAAGIGFAETERRAGSDRQRRRQVRRRKHVRADGELARLDRDVPVRQRNRVVIVLPAGKLHRSRAGLHDVFPGPGNRNARVIHGAAFARGEFEGAAEEINAAFERGLLPLRGVRAPDRQRVARDAFGGILSVKGQLSLAVEGSRDIAGAGQRQLAVERQRRLRVGVQRRKADGLAGFKRQRRAAFEPERAYAERGFPAERHLSAVVNAVLIREGRRDDERSRAGNRRAVERQIAAFREVEEKFRAFAERRFFEERRIARRNVEFQRAADGEFQRAAVDLRFVDGKFGRGNGQHVVPDELAGGVPRRSRIERENAHAVPADQTLQRHFRGGLAGESEVGIRDRAVARKIKFKARRFGVERHAEAQRGARGGIDRGAERAVGNLNRSRELLPAFGHVEQRVPEADVSVAALDQRSRAGKARVSVGEKFAVFGSPSLIRIRFRRIGVGRLGVDDERRAGCDAQPGCRLNGIAVRFQRAGVDRRRSRVGVGAGQLQRSRAVLDQASRAGKRSRERLILGVGGKAERGGEAVVVRRGA